MAMLRLIVAVALVATALSAPTWTKQLTMLSSSSGFTEVSSCACTNCVAPFWNSGISTSGGNKPLITKDECRTECQNRDSCVFALFDDNMPVNNKRIFNLGTSNEKSITINRETIWYNDTSVVGGQLIYRTHAINEFTCPSTFTSNGKTFSLSFSGDNVTITNQGSGGWSQDAEVTCAKKCGKARNEYHQNGATDDADCHWKAGGDLFHNGADTSTDSTNTRNFCWLYDTNHGMRPQAAGNGNSQYTCFTKDSAYNTPAPTSACTMSTLAQNNFDDRGDTTLSTSTTYQYTLSGGYTCKLSGWTHTRNYHKGFLRNTAGSGQAEVSGLVAGQTYQWRIYQYASSYGWSNTNAISANGVSKGTTSSTTDTSGGPTLTGTSTADSNGKITFVFTRTNHHTALSGIAMCPA
jgi:hypothetical protein